MIAIEASGLHKTYSGAFGRGGQTALYGVDLRIEAGSAFGLIGQNGAGKTTFIKILLGVVRPTRGSVRVLGGDPEDPAIRARIGYLPERLHLPDAWKPLTFLESVARLKRLRLRQAELESVLQRVGLLADVNRRIGGFSKGMRQRLGLAAALLGKPELLVLDEPTDGIDPLGRVEIRRLLSEEIARGATLFLNSHLLAETERVCTRVGILSSGKVVREGALEELRKVEPRWVVRFAPAAPELPLNEQALQELGFKPTEPASGPGMAFEIHAPDAVALNVALDRARSLGILLLSLEHDERDLEQVLADALGTSELPQPSSRNPEQAA